MNFFFLSLIYKLFSSNISNWCACSIKSSMKQPISLNFPIHSNKWSSTPCIFIIFIDNRRLLHFIKHKDIPSVISFDFLWSISLHGVLEIEKREWNNIQILMWRFICSSKFVKIKSSVIIVIFFVWNAWKILLEFCHNHDILFYLFQNRLTLNPLMKLIYYIFFHDYFCIFLYCFFEKLCIVHCWE